MQHRWRQWKLALVAGLIAPSALVGQQPTSQLPPSRLVFVIDLDTSGGFTGRGRGGVTVDSDGRVRATRIGASNREASECRAQLANDELDSLQRAVSAARLQPWPATFAPVGDDGCCDRHQWTLRLQVREANDQVRISVTTWYDGNEERMQKELIVIKDVALRALARALANCTRH